VADGLQKFAHTASPVGAQCAASPAYLS
jgi:hypothetical protein